VELVERHEQLNDRVDNYVMVVGVGEFESQDETLLDLSGHGSSSCSSSAEPAAACNA